MKKKHIGKIVFSSGKRKYSGTGNVVYTDYEKVIVATAAHCVYNHMQNTFFSNIGFYTDNIKEKVKIYKKNTNANFINNLDYTAPLFHHPYQE